MEGLQPLSVHDRCEGIHHALVELPPGAAVQLLNGLLQRNDAPVRTVGGHGVNRVADQDDARDQRNGIAGQAVRVTAAVAVLMVMGYYRRCPRQFRSPADDLCANGRVGSVQRNTPSIF